MEVFKFGGASVKNSEGVINLSKIIRHYPGQKVVVVSAMAKTTRALEKLASKFFKKDKKHLKIYQSIIDFHHKIVIELFDIHDNIYKKLQHFYMLLEKKLQQQPTKDFNYEYAQIVVYGELFSTLIISEYLRKGGIKNHWIDIRNCLKTNNKYREAMLSWEQSKKRVKNAFHFIDTELYVTQGFIASTASNTMSTLGKEGSDYTAAILGNMLNAKRVIIWKDVPGILNADPRFFEANVKINEISYREAVEMSFSGAKIIHPKTIKPLENKQIPLYVNSFTDYKTIGTIIKKTTRSTKLPPIITAKKSQVLLTLSPHDFSFIIEDYIAKIFYVLNKFEMKLNLMQHSAINFSIAIDHPTVNFDKFIRQLKNDFEVKYNDGLDLLSIRHYTSTVIKKYTKDKKIYLTQKTRNTAKFLLKYPK